MSQASRKKKIQAALAAAAAGVSGIGAAGQAATFTWDGNSGVDTNWNTANNWTANSGVPGAADVAQWSGASTPSPTTVNLAQNEAAQRLNVNSKDVTFNLNNFTLTVGGLASTITTHTSVATFNGPGTATFNTNRIEVGTDGLDPLEVQAHAKLNVQGGATLNTNAGFVIGDYRTGGMATVDGAGTVWNSKGQAQLGESGTGGRPQTQPRSRLFITNGATFNHDLGSYGTALNETFAAGHASSTQVLVQIQGQGSTLNFTGGYGSNINISTTATSTWNILDGGTFNVEDEVNGVEGNLPLSFNDGAQTATFNIQSSTANVSTMSAEFITIGGRSASDASRGNNVVNVKVGGLLQSRDGDGANIGIGVGEQAVLSLQGGSVSLAAGTHMRLLTSTTTGTKATLEGFGTIAGDVLAQADTRIRVGDVNDGAGGVVSGTGTIELTNGNFTTSNTSGANTATELLVDLQTTSGNPHDLIAASGAASVVTIGNNSTNAITFSVLGGGSLAAGAAGFMDFLIGETVNYGNTLLLDDVPNIDNLDDLLAAAGYTRVDAALIPGPGEYRYFKALIGPTDYAGDFVGLQAIRLDFAPIPEPAGLALLGLAALPLFRRRRR